jgi:polygalacturonase
METWWPMCGAVKYGWKEGMVAQRNGGRERLLMYGETSTPVYKRLMKPEDGMRPQLLNLHSCHTILIEGVTLLNSPFWVIHPLFCESLIVSGVTVFNRGPNGDGCDPESCKNVLIENCTFDTGDDCIAIKSGRNEDGRKWNIPSENIIVRGCMMRNGHGGVVIGSTIITRVKCTILNQHILTRFRITSVSVRSTIENSHSANNQALAEKRMNHPKWRV